MCDFFVKADPILYESRQRSVRIHGVITSIRLENLMWDVLAELAFEQRCTTNSLIARLHDEVMVHRGEVANFASFLRVTCVRYLKRAQSPVLVGESVQVTPARQDETVGAPLHHRAAPPTSVDHNPNRRLQELTPWPRSCTP